MNLIIKLLKLKITKFILSVCIVAFMASLYFYYDFYVRQYHKCIGFYYVNKGDKAYKKTKYQQAIDMYKIALRHYPGHSGASCNLGNIYVSFENYYEAVNAYENALKYNPNYMACRMDLGIILSEKMANYDRAIQEYGKVVNSNPKFIKIPFVYDNKKSINVNKGLAYYNMGLAYRGKAVYMADNRLLSFRYLKKARESYIQAKKYLKNDFDNTYNLALVSHLLGDYSSAGSEYCKAINIKPDSFEAHYNFALLLRSMHMNKEALAEFEKTTMLIDYYGKDEKTKYVYGIIGEIKRRILNEGGYDYLKDRVDLTSVSSDDIVYKKGKITADNQKDFNMTEQLKCTIQKEFKEIEE
ncbi:MAG: tetratricopeptide repeat protein [Candidatus Gastranaerophilales bacterium]|nr:tetratricopeptide repeat protein [Candidatus Gastranaerophilales bacterium]